MSVYPVFSTYGHKNLSIKAFSALISAFILVQTRIKLVRKSFFFRKNRKKISEKKDFNISFVVDFIAKITLSALNLCIFIPKQHVWTRYVLYFKSYQILKKFTSEKKFDRFLKIFLIFSQLFRKKFYKALYRLKTFGNVLALSWDFKNRNILVRF